MEGKESLTAKLAHISAEVGKIAKSGKNSQQGYNFIEYAAVAGKIRDLLEKYNVIIYPEVEEYDRDDITNKAGGAGYHYTLKMKFDVVNGDDQTDHFERYWIGEGSDYTDKGVNKAATAGTKYFLMRLLQISEKGDDGDQLSPEIATSTRTERRGVDFAEVRSHVAKIASTVALEAYWKDLHLTQGQAKILTPDFAKRRAELEGK